MVVRDTEGAARREGDHHSPWRCSREDLSSHGKILLYGPQGLGALHQLLLLVGLQCHVDYICQATVAQDTGDAQEDLVFNAIHALTH